MRLLLLYCVFCNLHLNGTEKFGCEKLKCYWLAEFKVSSVESAKSVCKGVTPKGKLLYT